MPEPVAVPLADLASLAIEHWRLKNTLKPILEQRQVAAARHALGKIEQFLKSIRIEAHDLTGMPYDPGLSATVIERVANPAIPSGTQLITETISPLLLYNGAVLRPAEIAVAHAP